MSSPLSRDDTPSPETSSIAKMETEKEKTTMKEVERGTDMHQASYPSQQKQILIMGALYLALFLVTLVRFTPLQASIPLTKRPKGSKHHLNSHTTNHRRI